MEETNTQQTITPSKAGKGLGIAGFVISLVALVLWAPIAGVAVLAALSGGMGIACFWAVVSLLGLVLSIMGLIKANKGGGKKGLSIAGLVIGAIAFILSISTIFGVIEAKKQYEKFGSDFMEGFQQGMGQNLDSLSNQLQESLDSVKTTE